MLKNQNEYRCGDDTPNNVDAYSEKESHVSIGEDFTFGDWVKVCSGMFSRYADLRHDQICDKCVLGTVCPALVFEETRNGYIMGVARPFAWDPVKNCKASIKTAKSSKSHNI